MIFFLHSFFQCITFINSTNEPLDMNIANEHIDRNLFFQCCRRISKMHLKYENKREPGSLNTIITDLQKIYINNDINTKSIILKAASIIYNLDIVYDKVQNYITMNFALFFYEIDKENFYKENFNIFFHNFITQLLIKYSFPFEKDESGNIYKKILKLKKMIKLKFAYDIDQDDSTKKIDFIYILKSLFSSVTDCYTEFILLNSIIMQSDSLSICFLIFFEFFEDIKKYRKIKVKVNDKRIQKLNIYLERKTKLSTIIKNLQKNYEY